ncbi:sulfotransferase family protein [Pontiella sulfatireligans]|uniref:Sulfotransferase domain-containing protein n=1 Tax=Pontiella sulfatireligans TaxID=2750658 RepID=A0A6C2ULB7_9BACT|nr:sulfotransferase [Pontiella sulfatireligans]VGO21030.1 hypothetical protein SCARR_03099 [Pontiella sulfatireligans]
MTPFFIIGNPRSGTTLLRLMLASHPDLLVTPECGFALWLAEEFEGKDPTLKAVRVEYAKKVYTSKKFDTWGITYEVLKSHLINSRPRTYGELVAEVYYCYGQCILNKKFVRWGDKNNFYINYINTIREIYPQAQFIHIIRDGRDIACSYQELNLRNLKSRFAPQLPQDVAKIALEWGKNVSLVRSCLDPLDSITKLEISFHDLIMSPTIKLKEICRFLGVGYDSRMLEYHELNGKNNLEPEQLMEWKEKTRFPPQQDRIGRYKKDLKPLDIKIFEQIAGDTLKHYGFPLSEDNH